MDTIKCPVCGLPIKSVWNTDACPNCGLDSVLAENFYGANAFDVWQTVTEYRISQQKKAPAYVPVAAPSGNSVETPSPENPGQSEISYSQVISPFSVGQTVFIGKKDNERIGWKVLEVADDKILVVVKDVMMQGDRYHVSNSSVTWETSSIRKKLNEEIYNQIFSEEDKSHILSTDVHTEDNPMFRTPGGNDTVDKLFLLSAEEVMKYYKSEADRVCFIKGFDLWWWLRTPGGNDTRAAVVNGKGVVDLGGDNVAFAFEAIRPAMWVRV